MKKLIIFTAILCLNSLLFAEKIYHPATIKISPKYSTTLYSDDNAKIEIAGDNYVRITFNDGNYYRFNLEEKNETEIENPVVLNPLLDCERCVILRDVDNDGNQEYILV